MARRCHDSYSREQLINSRIDRRVPKERRATHSPSHIEHFIPNVYHLIHRPSSLVPLFCASVMTHDRSAQRSLDRLFDQRLGKWYRLVHSFLRVICRSGCPVPYTTWYRTYNMNRSRRFPDSSTPVKEGWRALLKSSSKAPSERQS